jgi:hypothetical protein
MGRLADQHRDRTMERGSPSHVVRLFTRCLALFCFASSFFGLPIYMAISMNYVFFLNQQLSQTCELGAGWTGFPSVGAVQ